MRRRPLIAGPTVGGREGGPADGPDSGAPAHWIGASGDWVAGANWDIGTSPINGGSQTYDAFIDAPGAAPYAVNLGIPVTVDTLTIDSANATLVIGVGGSLGTVEGATVAAGQLKLDGGTLSGLVTFAGGSFSSTTSAASLLQGATLAGDFTYVGSNQVLVRTRVQGGLTLTGQMNLGGSAQGGANLSFEGNQTLSGGELFIPSVGITPRSVAAEAGTTLTIAPDHAMRGTNFRLGNKLTLAPGLNAVVNHGLVSSEGGSTAVTIMPDVFTNHGTVRAVGPGVLTISAPSWSNAGTLLADGGTVNLGGAYTTAGLGTVTRTNDGHAVITGQLDNAGATLAVTTTSGPNRMQGGTISGGTLAVDPGMALRVGTATRLDGVAVVGDLDLASQAGQLRVSGASSFSGVVNVAGSSSSITFEGEQALSTGTFNLLAGGSMGVAGGGALTLGPAVTVVTSGPSVTIGNAGAGPPPSLVNGGLITAAGAGSTTRIEVSSFTNAGTLEALAGSTLILGGPSSAWTNSGLIRVTDATLDLAGVFTPAALGSFERTGGTVRVRGVCDLDGGTLTLAPATTGSWRLWNGEVRDGTMAATGGASFYIQVDSASGTNGATLRNVTLNTDLLLDESSGNSFPTLAINDGFSGSGAVTLSAPRAAVFLNGTQTLASGTFALLGTSTNDQQRLVVRDNQTVTLGPGVVVQGGNANVGYSETGSNTGTLINQGRITADRPNLPLVINPGTFTNAGTIEAINQGRLALMGNWSGTGSVRVINGFLELGGAFSLGGTTFERSGGTVRMIGTLNNTGATLDFGAATMGAWTFGGATITGGTLNFHPGVPMLYEFNSPIAAARFHGVTINGTLEAVEDLLIREGLTLNGTLRVTNSLRLGAGSDSQTVTGGTIRLEPTGNAKVVLGVLSTQTLSPGTSVAGAGRVGYPFGVGPLYTTARLLNKGLVSADVPGQQLLLQPGSLTNEGTVEAKDGGVLTIHFDTQWANTGTMRAASGGTLVLNGHAATPSLAGVVNDGGTVRLEGVFSNVGQTLTVSPATGSWVAGGQMLLKQGTLNVVAPARFTSHLAPMLDGVTVNGDLHSGSQSAWVIRNGLTVNGVVHLNSNRAHLDFEGTQAFASGTVRFEGSDGEERVIQTLNGSTLTLGTGVAVRGGYGAIFTHAGGTVVNRGLVSADVPGQAIRIFTERFFNEGTVEAINGGTITFVPPADGPGGSLFNSGLLRVLTGASMVVGDFTQTPLGETELWLGAAGATPLSFAETAALAGTLRLVAEQGFSPHVGARYTMLSFAPGALSGTFSAVALPALPSGWSWDTSALYTQGSVGVIPGPGALGLLALAGHAGGRRRRARVVACAALAAGLQASALGQTQESVQLNPVNSNGVLNDPSNGFGQATLNGGYTLGRINVSGALTSLHTRTWRTDARILITAPGGASVTLQPFTSGTTFSTLLFSGSFFLAPGTDPAGLWTFRFYEIADDGGPAAVDARWNIVFSTTSIPPTPPNATVLPPLAAPGAALTGINAPASSVVWYRLTLPWGAHPGLGTYLDIDTFGTGFTPQAAWGLNDTQIALFTSDGALVASDDDTGPGFTSQLSFGATGRPARPDGEPFDGRNGSLAAGVYYLALAAYPLQPQPLYWGVTPSSPLNGQMALTIGTNLTAAAPACYANCDASTTPPVLNVQDFGCFLTRYAAGDAYANCDASTQSPALNVQDFGCFLTKYAGGCP
ncbi:MAG: hypothetical protein WD749_14835 [Phycisphaerales bacterium]